MPSKNKTTAESRAPSLSSSPRFGASVSLTGESAIRNPQSAVQGVIFDMGDIFFDATPWRRWLTARLNDRGVNVTYEQLVRKWEALLVDVYRGRASYWPRLGELLGSLGLDGQARDELIEAAREQDRRLRVERRLFEGVETTLGRLRQAGLRLAVLSDTESSESKVRAMLAELGIEGFFDAVITSLDIGAAKPEPTSYQAAADALGLDLARCAFVGHDMDELEGAQAAGLLTVAFNYAPGAPADRYVERFEQLFEAVVSSQ